MALPRYSDTVNAGFMAEQEAYDVIKQFADCVYRNVKIPTLYTANGYTEIDLLAGIKDSILVAEVKNVKGIQGTPLDTHWTMEGANTGRIYSALNVLTQNRIHVRAIKARWFEMRQEFPLVLPIVIVPNLCVIPDALHDAGVLHVNELTYQLAELVGNASSEISYRYSLEYFVAKYQKEMPSI